MENKIKATARIGDIIENDPHIENAVDGSSDSELEDEDEDDFAEIDEAGSENSGEQLDISVAYD
jgi:hypothetical protein